jgi:hypothetical protein
MAGDLLVFLRGEDKHHAARRGIADGIARCPVPSFVEAHANPGQPVADRGARFPIIFSNAARAPQSLVVGQSLGWSAAGADRFGPA